jgi:hypothetical protein
MPGIRRSSRMATKVCLRLMAKSKSSSGSTKRTLIKPKGDARYIRRDAKGRITESDDVGRSLAQDRRKKAKTKVSSGQGDKGDQKRKGAKAR